MPTLRSPTEKITQNRAEDHLAKALSSCRRGRAAHLMESKKFGDNAFRRVLREVRIRTFNSEAFKRALHEVRIRRFDDEAIRRAAEEAKRRMEWRRMAEFDIRKSNNFENEEFYKVLFWKAMHPFGGPVSTNSIKFQTMVSDIDELLRGGARTATTTLPGGINGTISRNVTVMTQSLTGETPRYKIVRKKATLTNSSIAAAEEKPQVAPPKTRIPKPGAKNKPGTSNNGSAVVVVTRSNGVHIKIPPRRNGRIPRIKPVSVRKISGDGRQ